MNKPQINIGILGASKIAPDAIVSPAKNIDKIHVYAVASRSKKRAEEFAGKYNVAFSYDNYTQLIENKKIDVIYISLTNEMHYEYAIKAIQNEKHVFIEKPICLYNNEYQHIEKEALKHNVIVLEALMTQHHPWQKKVKELVVNKKYGNIKRIISYNNFILDNKNDFRVTSGKGGGAIYDSGCYCIQFFQQLVNPNFKSITCLAKLSNNGVETEFDASFLTNDSINIEIHSSFNKPFKASHTIECEKGAVEIKNFFRPGFGFNKMYIDCTDKLTGEMHKIAFEPMNYFYNQLVYLTDVINTGKFVDKLRESGKRVQIMEELHKIKQNKSRLQNIKL